MKKNILSLIAIIAFEFAISAQNVNIPDANFKAYLLNNHNINTDSDKSNISIKEANDFNGELDIKVSHITSLTGIEEFINVHLIDCGINYLTSLDLTKNIALTTLYCYENQLTTLYLPKSNSLTYIYCGYNKLKALDVSSSTALTTLYCYDNQLTSLDISNNIALINLSCSKNQIKALDVTSNINLVSFNCSYNQLTNLDVINNTKLTKFGAHYNQITNLDISKNIALDTFSCKNNELKVLDISKNIALKYFDCTNNTNLSCIQALNSQNKTYWTKDATAEYNENCNSVQGVGDEIINQPKTILAIYNLQGQQITNTYQGLVIIRYTDGTSKKQIK